MAHCPKCGAEVGRGDNYCRECGAFLGEEKSHIKLLLAALALIAVGVAIYFHSSSETQPTREGLEGRKAVSLLPSQIEGYKTMFVTPIESEEYLSSAKASYVKNNEIAATVTVYESRNPKAVEEGILKGEGREIHTTRIGEQEASYFYSQGRNSAYLLWRINSYVFVVLGYDDTGGDPVAVSEEVASAIIEYI